MASVNLSLPNISKEELSKEETLKKVLSYLYQLNEQLRYELTHIDKENFAGGEGVSESVLSDALNRKIQDATGSLQIGATSAQFRLMVQQQLEILRNGIQATEESIAQLNVLAGQIQLDVQSKVDQSEFDALRVSNPNLVVGSSYGEVTDKWQVLGGEMSTFVDEQHCYRAVGDGSFVYLLPDYAGRAITLSCYVKNIATSGSNVNVYLRVSDEIDAENPLLKTVGEDNNWHYLVGTIEECNGGLGLILEGGADMLIKDLKIEEGTNATAWTPAIEDPFNTAQTLENSGLKIDPAAVTLYSTGQIIAMIDDVTRLLIDESGVNTPMLYADEAHAPNIVERLADSTIPWKGTIQKSLDECPKYLNRNATLTIPAGTYLEDVEVRGFYGSMIRLLFEPGTKLNGTLTVYNCSHVVIRAEALGDAAIYPRSAVDATVCFYAVQRAQISNMQVSGYRNRTLTNNGTDNALYFNSCHALVENCCLEYANKGLSTNYSVVFANNNRGGIEGNDPLSNANLNQGVLASSGSHVHLVGTYPMGGKAGYSTYRGVINTYDLGDATPGGMEYREPDSKTQVFTITKHCTYFYSVKRMRDDQTDKFSQGSYGVYQTGGVNWRIGCMWFNDAVTELAGREIVKAELKIRRAGGGNNQSPVPVYLGTANVKESEFTSTLTPAFTQGSTWPAGTLARSEEGTYDVTSLMSAFMQGHALAVRETPRNYGIGSSSDYSPAYANFYGKGSSYEPVLTVTYR